MTETTTLEENPRYADRSDVPTEEPTRLGDALPVVDGEIVLDAEPRIMPGYGCTEAIASRLAHDPDAPEAEMPSHGGVGVSRALIGANAVDASYGDNVPEVFERAENEISPHTPPPLGSEEALRGDTTSGDLYEGETRDSSS